VHFKLVHAPGETDDQLFVWAARKTRSARRATNYYRAFPNLYTIRAPTYRDLKGWAPASTRAARWKPRSWLPSHTRPLEGEQQIADTLNRAIATRSATSTSRACA